MATTKITMAEGQRKAAQIRSWLTALEAVLDGGDDIVRDFPTMIDGDGSDAAHFDQVTALVGFQNGTMAKAFWDEFQSAWSKVSGDGSVSSVNAALKQIIAKCR